MDKELALRTFAYLIRNYKTHNETIINEQEIEAIEFMLKNNEDLEQQCKKQKEVIDKAIQLLEDDNICADIRRMKPKWNENKYGVEYELLDILKEVEK